MTSDSQDIPTTDANTADTSTETADLPTNGEKATPSFGWNAYAERINGRFAMVGFIALLLLELITRKDFFTWLGF